MPNALERLQEANKARNKEWDPLELLGPLFFATELAGEIGEACNIVKKLERERLGIPGSRATIAQLAEELADGIICLSLLANQYKIDLPQAVIDKFDATSAKIGLSVRIGGEFT